MPVIYDTIGDTYSHTRRPDERIANRIVQLLALPHGARVLDIGAGTGSYSLGLADRGFDVTAVEPSTLMSAQASPHSRVSWVTASAESLPFDSSSFDAAIMVLAIHHFADRKQAFSEARRVVNHGPILIFTYDPSAIDGPWLFEYFPEFRAQIETVFPSTDHIISSLSSRGEVSSHPFPLPHDLKDAFAGAAWRDPERYLDKSFRDGTSAFRILDPEIIKVRLERLRSDLGSGEWDKRYSYVRSLNEYDHGYTFIVANGEQTGATNPPRS